MAITQHKKNQYKSLKRFIFSEPHEFFAPFDSYALSPSDPLSEPFLAFKGNLQSAIAVGSIPFLLVNTGVLDQRYTSLLSAERIRQLGKDGTDEEKELRAHEIASNRMAEEMTNEERIDSFARVTLSVLDRHLARTNLFDEAASELLTQLIVMAWSAFETLVHDSIRVILNLKPLAVLSVARDPHYKKVWLGREELLQQLVASNFDLSRSMGDLFCESVRMDNYASIADVVKLVMQDPKLDERLKDSNIWRIAQDRNLIAHRRGIVDKKYQRLVSDLEVGQRFSPNADYVEHVFLSVRDIGIAFYDSAVFRLAGSVTDNSGQS